MRQIDQIMTMYRHDLSSFTQFAFQILNPYQLYKHNWHVEVIANVLDRVKNGDLKKVIINLPPRMLKSHCASIAFPAHLLGRDPRLKLLYLHAGDELGRNLHEECSQLMQHPRYRALFPHAAAYDFDQRKIATSHGGGRRYAAYAGKITGLGAVILITQRLHADDLTAHILKNNQDWHYVNMSAVALHDEEWDLTHGRKYKRLRGQVIHSDRLSLNDLASIAKGMNGYFNIYRGSTRRNLAMSARVVFIYRPYVKNNFMIFGKRLQNIVTDFLLSMKIK